MSCPSMEDDLQAWGKVIDLETTGRHSGRPRHVSLGFVVAGDGSLLVAASGRSSGWAHNLRAHPACHVTRDGGRRAFVATELFGNERNAVIGSLILQYGTPAERLGDGPAFRLEPEA